jgi:HPt (histidine-containing phosphotransfer) domain-containing protein
MTVQSRRIADERVMDVTVFMERVSGDYSLAKELVDLFVIETPRLMEQTSKAIAENNPVALANAAHTIRGAASNFSAQKVVKAAAAVERMGRENNLGGVQEAFQNLKDEVQRLCDEFVKIIGDSHEYDPR